MLVMENINMTHIFRHPKFYRIPRDKTDQAISDTSSTEASERAPDSGLKLQAASHKLQAPSDKRPSQSNKRQASSHKQQAPRS